tara:strand:+ start:718 stop:1017 length:300 start_codon:yes stop_codon:yes gene_type:complete
MILVGLLFYGCGGSAESEFIGGAENQGEQLYLIHCARCHGASGDLGASGSKNLKISVLTDTEIQEIITQGKGVMPAYGQTLQPKEKVAWLSEYVLTLRK